MRVCGAESLESAIRPIRVATGRCHVAVPQIRTVLEQLVHAAGYVHDGEIVVREDVGHHNALDKLVGALAAARRPDGFLVMTSRASYEIVQKAATANIAVVVAISAPTALAIELALRANITLVAFARGETMNIYSGSERVR